MNQNETKPLTVHEMDNELRLFYSNKDGNGKGSGYGLRLIKLYAAQQVKQVTEERDKSVELLDESRVQLQYLDKRFPTGTTPNVVSRIETFLNSLNAAGSDTGNK